MVESKTNKNLTISVEKICQTFIKTIGTKNEPAVWGMIASKEDIVAAIPFIKNVAEKNKNRVSSVAVLTEPFYSLDQIQTFGKKLTKNTIVYISQAELWNQNLLLKLTSTILTKSSKPLMAYTDFCGLSMGIHHLIVNQKITEDGPKPWAINMTVPISELASTDK